MKTAPPRWSSRASTRRRTRDCGRFMTSLVRHLHAFVKDVEPTVDEWDTGDRLPHPHRADVHRRTSGVHPALRRAGRVDARRDDQRPRTGTPPSQHRSGPVPHGRLPAARARRRTSPLDGKGEPCLVTGQVTERGRHPVGRGARRRVAGQRRRLLRRPATRRPAGTEPARAVHHRRRGHVLVPHGRAPVLPHPRRRPGGRAAGGHRTASQPAGARALHRHGRPATVR